ncbi:hypothetical protein [Corynebacterium caspium]|nr:hypothetical protein [Corynebacterium caspium]WKD58453.1 hypothetical protein CCASP_00080 [Corynebacterium caspium DSM 44850]
MKQISRFLAILISSSIFVSGVGVSVATAQPNSRANYSTREFFEYPQQAPVQNPLFATEGTFGEDSVNISDLTPEELQVVKEAAQLLEELDQARSAEERKEVLISNLGYDEASATAESLGLTIDELVSDRTVPNTNGDRGVGEFLSCMKGHATDDLKSIFNVNAVSYYIGKEKYFEAALAAGKHLAKQGIRRNAYGLIGILAWYGVRCAAFK